MAATRATKAPNRSANPPTNPPLVQPAALPVQSEPTMDGKKKKKKKGKAKGGEAMQANHSDDELPQLEPVNMPPQAVLRRSGLSPELESVHLSTTASLSASAAAAARLNATAQAQAELLATANDLYRKMDTDTMPDDDDYWASLPSHIKNFVKMTYSQNTNPNVNANERSKAQSMFAIAQQMIQSGAGRTSPKGGQPPGAYPFDPAIFSDPAFSLAMEQTIAATAPLPPAPGQPPRGPLPPTNVVLLNEFGSGEDQQHMDDEYYSEDEVDENVEEHGVAFGGYNNGAYQRPPTEAIKKKSKKKKKKGSVVANPLSPSALASNPTPVTQPHPTTRPPAAAPLTSSRAAGKQPMSYTNAVPPPVPPSSRARPTASKPNSHYHHSSPTSSQTSHSKGPTQQQSKLWSTNSTEERERIKVFWLGLGEEERRALVKVEKEAVLKKMKEQQKHSCSCAVCGRKRHAIEEELEVLYDAYYEELEQYANHQQQYASSGGRIPPPPGPGPFPGSVELDKNGAVVEAPHHLSHPKKGHPPGHGHPRKVNVNGTRKKQESEFEDEEGDDEEYEEEEYEQDDEEEEEDEEGEDDVEDEEPEDKRSVRNKGTTAPPRNGRTTAINGTKPSSRDDFFNFGNNLTVTGPGNILTVADDLLKNDGQKFLEMMEQLAERRMQREEEAANEVGMDSEDDEEEEEGDEEEDEDEEDEDEDDEEVLTEEQKMEEGKRMFSIFAARMFEQRVLQAYREKVAQERQMQLLRELEDEDKAAQEREARKQKENQKKKQKKLLQKQHKEEERKQREAEKAAEEAEQKLKQQMQEDETRKRREEERARREALRKQQEEERLKKEEERRKRQVEEKERQAEQERKKKEREERAKAERRDREEKERKAKEEREAKLAAEKAAAAAKREQQEKEEREKRLAKEAKDAEERERKEREAKERERLRQMTNPPKSRGPPSSPRNAITSGPSRNVPVGLPKKILQKPMPTPGVIASSSSSSQPVAARPLQQRPAINTQAQVTVAPQPQHPGISSASHLQSPGPSTTPISMTSFQSQFPSPGGPMSASMSPRPAPPFSNGPIVPPYMSYGLPGSSVTPGLPGPAIGPPRAYPVAPSAGFESFRPLAPPTPIAPPSKGLSNPPGSPIGPMFNATPGAGPSSNRRGSVAERPAPGGSFGVVQRPPAPIAPIARPYAKEDEKSANSPKLKSPRSTPGSSEPVLGSSALVADDDEPIMPPNRRVVAGAVGQMWGAPGTDTRPNWPGGQGVSYGAPSRTPNGLWGTTPVPDQWQTGFPPHTPFASTFSTHSPPPGGN